jgi:hypothetical protein
MVEEQTRNLREDLSRNIEAGQAEFEERANHNLREDLSKNIEATRQDVEATRRALEARTRRASGNSAGANADHVQTEAAHAFIDGIRDREVKQHLLLGGACMLNEALNQALRIVAARAAAWPTARMRDAEVNDRYAGNAGNAERRAKTRERGRGYLSRQSHPRPEDAHQSTTRIDNVVHRAQGHLRAKMRVAHVGRLASYLGPARDEQP